MAAPVGDPPVIGIRRQTLLDPDLGRDVLTTSVVTPEAVLLEFRSAGIGSRVLAKVVDLLILVMVSLAGFAAIGVLASTAGETPAIVLATIFGFLLLFGYPCSEAFLGGATPGKRALGIEVITVDGGPVRLRHAAIRATVALVDFLLPPGGLLALGAALLTRRSQRIGDLAAGTLVVRSQREPVPSVVFPIPWGADATAFAHTCDASRLPPEWYALLRDYWLRWPSFDPFVRRDLAIGLAADLETITGVVRPLPIDPPSYLAALLYAAQHDEWQRLGLQQPPPPAPTPGTVRAPGPTPITVSAEELRQAPPPAAPPAPWTRS